MSFNPIEHRILFSSPERDALSAWTQHIPFGMLLIDLVRPRLLVELGAHYGASYCAFCQAVKELNVDCRCFAVDNWNGDEHAGFYGPEVLADLQAHHDPRYEVFSTLIQLQFDDARDMFADKSIDVLHIDGYHTYEAVRHDFDNWLPKMSTRGVVLFHDIAERRGEFGVWRLWAELKAQYPHHLEFYHGHGLGLVVVGEAVPEGLRPLLDVPEAQWPALRELFHELGARIVDQREALHQRKELQLSEEKARTRIQELQLSEEKARTRIQELQLSEEKARTQLDAVRAEHEAQLTALQTKWEGEQGRAVSQAAREAAQERHALTRHYDVALDAERIRAAQAEGRLGEALWQLSWLESSRGVRIVKLARASRTVLRHKGPFSLAKHIGLWLVGRRGYYLRDIGGAQQSGSSRESAPSSNRENEVKRMLQSFASKDPATFTETEKWYSDANPEVSIVILNLNKADFTIRCMKEIWKYTTGHRYEVIVVDNGSTADDYIKLAQYQGRFKLIRLSRNRYFGEGNNIGVEEAKGDYLVFLNNDAFVTPGWLPPLMDTFITQQDVGAVGPMFVYPDGTLQEAGSLVNPDGTTNMLGRGQNAKDPEFRRLREVDYCSAAGLMVRRDLFDAVAGFDLCWEPAYYEDVDLCMKIKALGKKVYYCPGATIVHIEHFTSLDSSHAINFGNVVDINRQKFIERWKDYLGDDGTIFTSENTGPYTIARLYGSQTISERTPVEPLRRTVGIYTPYDLTPGGGEKVIFTMAEHLSKFSQVYLILDETYSAMRLRAVGHELDVDLSQVKTIKLSDAWRLAPFDIFFAMGNEVVPPTAALGRENYFLCQFPFPRPNHVVVERSSYWDRYDRVVVYSEFVQDNFRRVATINKLPEKPVSVLYPPCFTKGAWNLHAEEKRQLLGTQGPKVHIISVGRFFPGEHTKRHDVMIDAFRSLVELTNHQVKLELHLAGSLPPTNSSRDYYLSLVERSEGLPVKFHLNIDRSELEDLYTSATFYWHATGIDADPLTNPETMEHFGISVVEAMGKGCIPLVVNKGGPADIVQNGVSGVHYARPRDLARETSRLLDDPSKREALRSAAIDRAMRYSKDAFTGRLDEILFREAIVGAAGQGSPTEAAQVDGHVGLMDR